MIEAFACGTPVIAFRSGSVLEVVNHGISGLIVDNVAEAVDSIPKIRTLDRAEVRRYFEKHFTVSRMASDYLSVYSAICGDLGDFQ